MVSEAVSDDLVMDAYEHLYDLVYLRTHPLAALLLPDPCLSHKDRAWRLHQMLLDVIEELNPGPGSPRQSHEWRLYRLMVLRYAEGLDVQAVADQLVISRRHFYREVRAAMQSVAHLLRERVAAVRPTSERASHAAGQQPPRNRRELLRLEEARLAQRSRDVRLDELVAGLLSILQPMVKQRGLDVRYVESKGVPSVSVDRTLLRQLLLGVLGFLIEHAEQGVIELTAQSEDTAVRLSLRATPPVAIRPMGGADAEARLGALQEIANLGATQVQPVRSGDAIVGFDMRLPAASGRSVLIVDDNVDTLDLLSRYLIPHGYRVFTAQTARDALDQARQLQPRAVILDLMMPDRDGWDVLQTLRNQPSTGNIPIIVCSVLNQKDLALSLGASAFRLKPVTESTLLAALQALETG